LLEHRDRCIPFGIIGHLGQLDIQREIDQYRARAPLTGRPKGLAHDAGRLRWFRDAPGTLAHRLGDVHDIDRLERLFADLGAHALAGDGDQWDRINLCGIEARHKVGRRRPRGANGHAQALAAHGAGIAIGRVKSTLLMPGGIVFDEARGPQVLVHRVDGSARDTKRDAHTLVLENPHHKLRDTHHVPPWPLRTSRPADRSPAPPPPSSPAGCCPASG